MMRQAPHSPKVGVFGGSFDPVHAGHVALLRACSGAISFDRILVVPTAHPPHKEKLVASDRQRLEMLRLALRDFPNAEISEHELRKKGPCYTFDLLTAFRAENPHADFYFLLGEDSALDLPKWHRFPEVLELAHWVVARRKGLANRAGEWTALKEIKALILVEADLPDVSSSQLRAELRRGALPPTLAPGVAAYLKSTNPYANSGMTP